jgi:hypothetical protein
MAQGVLNIQVVNGYNLIVDSNVQSPPTYAPRAAFIGAQFCNIGTAPLTNVTAHTGNYDAGRSLTVTTVSASTTVTSAALFAATDVGQSISGPGIPAGATVTAFSTASSITISAPATASGAITARLDRRIVVATTSGSKTVTSAGLFLASDAGLRISGTGIPAGATITSFNSTSSVTISVAATATGGPTARLYHAAGIFPVKTFGADALRPHLANTGDYSLNLEVGTGTIEDATRYIGTLAVNECRIQYWLFGYPACVNQGTPRVSDQPPCTATITGGVGPEDDLSLDYDLWATADGVANKSVTRSFTMRNEISAAANKIWPNTASKVPDEYLSAIQDVIGWGTIGPDGQPLTESTAIYPGQRVITTQGIWYDLGNVNHGFDNNGDLIPDVNAWMQPVGDAGAFDSACFRMINVYGIVIVKLVTGGELLIPMQNLLYHENLPDNTGVVGLIYYQFVATKEGCSSSMTPYQEAASGFDNEKFAGDYGLNLGLVSGAFDTDLSFTKTDGVSTVAAGGTLSYVLSLTNKTGVPLGAPELGTPLVLRETIPTGTTFVAGSADDSPNTNLTEPTGSGSYVQGYTDINGDLQYCRVDYQFSTAAAYTLFYSTDSGVTWSLTEPASGVTDIRWMLAATLSLDGGPSNRVCNATNGVFDNGTLQVSVPSDSVLAGTTSGSSTVTAIKGIFFSGDVGKGIKGVGIPSGATIATFVDASTVTISANATATSTAGVVAAIARTGSSLSVRFQVTVNSAGTTSPVICNTGYVGFGPVQSNTTASDCTLVSGPNNIAGVVWEDDGGTGGTHGNGVIDNYTEVGIGAGARVDLYYDANADGEVSATDLLYGTTVTDALSARGFAVTTTNGSATVTSAALFLATDVGKRISGTGIPAGAFITAFTSTSSVTISANATAGATVTGVISSGGDYRFVNVPDGNFIAVVKKYDGASVAVSTTAASTTLTSAGLFLPSDVGRSMSGTGIPLGATITAYTNSSSVTISSAATATGSITAVFDRLEGGVTSMAIGTTSGSATVTSSSLFVATDVGRPIWGPGIPSGATITAFTSASSVTISSNATATSSVTGYVGRSGAPTTNTSLAVGTTNASTTVTSAALFLSTDVGMRISGTGIPADAYITAFASASSVTISAAATATGSPTATVVRGGSMTVGITNASTTVTSSGLFLASDVGKPISGTGIPAGSTITGFTDASTVTISSAATSAGTTAVIGRTAVNDFLASRSGEANTTQGWGNTTFDPNLGLTTDSGILKMNEELGFASLAISIDLDHSNAGDQGLTTNELRQINFGFAPPFLLTKSTLATTVDEGETFDYTILLENRLPSVGVQGPTGCQYTAWATSEFDGGTSTKEFTNETFVLGSPDRKVATGLVEGGGNREITGSGFRMSRQAGNITKVEALFMGYYDITLDDDSLDLKAILGGTFSTNIPTAAIDSFIGPPTSLNPNSAISWDMTSVRTWSFSDSFSTLQLYINPRKSAAADDKLFSLDAIGVRVTTDADCEAGASTTLSPVPLQDRYDDQKLAFVSAVPAPTSVSGRTIQWDDVGPIAPGSSNTVTVTMRALDVAGLATGTCATTSAPSTPPPADTICNLVETAYGTKNVYYADGRKANDDDDKVAVNIQGKAELRGTVWRDTDNDGWAIETGEPGLPNVSVTLYGCYTIVTNVLYASTQNAACSGTEEWRVVRTTTTSPTARSFTVGTTNGSTAITSSGLFLTTDVGSLITGTGFPTGAFISKVISASSATISVAATGTASVTGTVVGGAYEFLGLDTGYYIIQVGDTDGVITTAGTSPFSMAQTAEPADTQAPNTGGSDVGGAATQTAGVCVGTCNNTWGTSTANVRNTGTDLNRLAGTTEEKITGINFGYFSANALLYGNVYHDKDGDGAVREPEDTDLDNFVVKLYVDANGSGSLGAQVGTVTTDSTGDFSFSVLPSRTFTVGTTNASTTVTSASFLATDVGASITGTGIQAGSRITAVTPGVSATLSLPATATGSVSATLTATYVIVVTPETLPNNVWTETRESAGNGGTSGTLDNRILVTVAGGTMSGSHDFGYTLASSSTIGDTVYIDFDGDGVQDTTEGGIPDITVWLYDDVDRDGSIDSGIDLLIQTDVTDATGKYLFTSLAEGSYIVVVDTADADFPSGTTQTADPDIFSGVIGDQLWIDADGDTVFDTGENGVIGTTVLLYADDGNGTFSSSSDSLVAATVTNVNGVYRFTGLPAGNYFVQVDETTLPNSALVRTSADPTSTMITLATNSSSVLTADAGYSPSSNSALGNRLWHDLDGDGVQDAGEVGIPDIDITVTGTGCAPCTATTDASGFWFVPGLTNAAIYTIAVDSTDLPRDFVATNAPITARGITVTTTNGSATVTSAALFTDLDLGRPISGTGFPAGAYIIAVNSTSSVTISANATASGSPTGTLAATRTAGTFDNMNVDFGYRYTTPASTPTGNISGSVFLDADGDTVLDNGEEMAGIIVNLLDEDGYVVASTTSNTGTTRSFTVTTTNGSATVTSAALFLSTDVGSPISGTGIPSGAYISAFTSTSSVTISVNATASGSPTAAIKGAGYVFPGVFIGNYSVEALASFGTRYSSVFLSSTTGFPNLNVVYDATIYTTADDMSSVSVDGVHSNLLQDFGYRRYLGSVGDTVYWDANENGTQDLGEPGFSGVTVRLRDCTWTDDGDGAFEGATEATGCSLIATTTTTADDITTGSDESGKYLFANLDDLATDHYYVIEVDTTASGGLPGAANFGLKTNGATTIWLTADPETDGAVCSDLTGSTDPQVTVCESQNMVQVFRDGLNYTGGDFGYQLRAVANYAKLGDTLWIDADGDGLKDFGEAGIPAITVFLDDDNDGVIDTRSVAVSTTSGSAIVTSAALFLSTDVGMAISGTGIPDGSYISAFTSTSSVTITRNATATGSVTATVADSTTETDTDGYYLFTGLPDLASYNVRVNNVSRTITLTRAGTLATATSTAHGLTTGQTVTVQGATSDTTLWNGTFVITVTGANTFTYTMTGTPGTSPPTGTITAYAALDVDWPTLLSPAPTFQVNCITGAFPTTGTPCVADTTTTTPNVSAVTITSGAVSTISDGIGGTTDTCTDCDLNVDFGYRYVVTGGKTLRGTICIESDTTGNNVFGNCGATNTTDGGVSSSEVALGGISVSLYRWTDAGTANCAWTETAPSCISGTRGTLDPSDTFTFLGSTNTDANGDYSFINVPDNVIVVFGLNETQNLKINTNNTGTSTTGLTSVEGTGVLSRQLYDGFVDTDNDGVHDTTEVTTVVRQALFLGTTSPVIDLDFAFDSTLGGTILKDYGDLPDTAGVGSNSISNYNATLLTNGASHKIRPTYTVGTTNGSTTVTSASFVSTDVGSPIVGAGIPSGATITAVNPGVSATISYAATATASITARLGWFLGTTVTSETNGQPSATAVGDTDEGAALVVDHGVYKLTPGEYTDCTVPPNSSCKGGLAEVAASGEGWLVAWMDFNQDGDFADTGEQIINRPLVRMNGATPVTSVTRSGAVATVTVAGGHEFSTGQIVTMSGATSDPTLWNGTFAITVTGPTTFTYTMSGTPGTASPTGTMVYATDLGLVQMVPFSVPDDPTLITQWGPNPVFFARFRLYPSEPTLASATGAAMNSSFQAVEGEVEDYQFMTTMATTRARVTAFVARDMGGSVALEWETTSEMGTVGFFLNRWDERQQGFVRVNERLIPSLLTPHGGLYRYIDPAASVGQNYRYELIEVEASGKKETKGPYDVNTTVTMQADAAAQREQSIEPDPRPTGFAMAARVGRVRAEQSADVYRASALRNNTRAAAGAKISVTESGIHYVSLQDIQTRAGFTVDRSWLTSSKNLYALTNRGDLVPFTSSPDSTGLLFYGQAINSNFARDNVYWLGSSDRNSPRMKERKDLPTRPPTGNESFVRTLRFEEDHQPAPGLSSDADKDFWFWNSLYSWDPALAFTFRTDGAKRSGSASIVIRLKGGSETETDPDHHAALRLNGQNIGDLTWDGLLDVERTIEFSASILVDGENTLELENVADTGAEYSLIYLDSFDVQFESLYRATGNRAEVSTAANASVLISGFTRTDVMVFDVTNPKEPVRVMASLVQLPGSRYGVALSPKAANTVYYAVAGDAFRTATGIVKDVASALKTKNNRAEYIIVTNQDMSEAARALADYRSDLTSKVVDIEDVYDEFNYGIPDPHALRAFLGYAYAEWTQRPKYVLLGGDGTWDYKNSLGLGAGVIPPMMISTPSGVFPSDVWFANVDTAGPAPEIAIGRLPASTPEELTQMITKIQVREAASGPWMSRALMAADTPDEAGDFPASSAQITGSLPSGSVVTPISVAELGGDEARTQFINGINTGVGMINYIGHGGYWMLSNQGMLWSGDEQLLTNSAQTPIMTAMTCTVANFGLPWIPSLGELLVTKAEGGVSALWAPTGESENELAVPLAEAFYASSSINGPQTRIGDAIMASMKAYERSRSASYMLGIYTLLGDPAMRLR